MNKNRYRDQIKVGDYQFYCMTCGQVCWYSETTVLAEYTGLEGMIVCPNCVDEPQYGLAPYTIEPEASIPYAQPNQQDTTTYSLIPDFSIFDPLSGLAITNDNWENIQIEWNVLTIPFNNS